MDTVGTATAPFREPRADTPVPGLSRRRGGVRGDTAAAAPAAADLFGRPRGRPVGDPAAGPAAGVGSELPWDCVLKPPTFLVKEGALSTAPAFPLPLLEATGTAAGSLRGRPRGRFVRGDDTSHSGFRFAALGTKGRPGAPMDMSLFSEWASCEGPLEEGESATRGRGARPGRSPEGPETGLSLPVTPPSGEGERGRTGSSSGASSSATPGLRATQHYLRLMQGQHSRAWGGAEGTGRGGSTDSMQAPLHFL